MIPALIMEIIRKFPSLLTETPLGKMLLNIANELEKDELNKLMGGVLERLNTIGIQTGIKVHQFAEQKSARK